jgi:GAF domain-containing protein
VHSSGQESFCKELEARLNQTGAIDSGLQTALDLVLERLACTAGTIHRFDPHSRMLHLRIRRNIPDGLLPRIQQIPFGKGMAGLAVERREPIQVCNLQTDNSGVAKPGAKESGMHGSVALPIFVGDQVVGVLGVAKPTAYEFSEAEIAFLLDIGRVVGKFMSQSTSGTTHA